MVVAVLGEALIDLILDGSGSFNPHKGGSPFNVARGLARLGIEVNYVAPLSDDAFGHQLFTVLLDEGIGVSIARRSKFPTSLAIVTVDELGRPGYRIYRDGVADKDFSVEEVISSLPGNLDVFHAGSLALTPDLSPKIREIFGVMRERGVIISVDLNVRLGACLDTTSYLSGLRDLLPMVDIVKASDEDLDHFGISSDVHKAAAVIYTEMESGLLVVTRGANGAIVHASGGCAETIARRVVDIKDTIGAGDTFHAGFLASLFYSGKINDLRSITDPTVLMESLEFASAAAAVSLLREGCHPPTRREVERVISGGL